MPTQKIEIDLDVPDGWELTGEYRAPKEGEWYLRSDGRGRLATWDYSHFKEGRCLILRRGVSKHTPGPWTNVAVDILDGELRYKNPADIPLILAAPDLLEACEQLLNGHNDYYPMMERAVAKAKGPQ